jgi:PAS domain S-box-containing protein
VSILLIGVLTELALSNVLPVFLTSTGPTLLRRTVLATLIILLFGSFVIFELRYFKTKSPILYWYSLAVALFGLAMVAAYFTVKLGDPLNWLSRITIYLSGIYFIIALLSRGTETESDVGLSTKWAEAFRSDREQVEALFSNMLEGFAYRRIIVDKGGKPVDYVYISVNDAFEKMTEQKREDVIGKRGTQFLSGDDKDLLRWVEVFGRVALGGKPAQFEDYSKVSKKWFYVSLYSPKKGYFATILEDITERKKAEEELKESRESYRQLFNSLPDPFNKVELIYDHDGKPIDFRYREMNLANLALERTAGKNRDELIGKTAKELFGTVEDYWLELMDKVVKTGVPSTYVNYSRSTNKHWEAFVWKAGENQVGIISKDVTERKKAEEAIARQAALIDLSPDAIIVRTLEGTINFWSKGATELYGYSRDEAIGQISYGLFKTRFPEPLNDIVSQVETSGRWSGELLHKTKDGREIIV